MTRRRRFLLRSVTGMWRQSATSRSQNGGVPRVAWVCVGVGVIVAGWAMVAIPARATYGARTTADEPQYLLSALSLAEDGNLWIDDELAERAYEPFHEVTLPLQTEALDDGHAVSPHDPLLPVVLAAPMGLGGWAAAKATLALLAGVLAGVLTWTAHRRFTVPLTVAAGTVLVFGLAAPLSAYATQVYPELPAALAVTVAIAALVPSRPLNLASIASPEGGIHATFEGGPVAAWGLAVIALPWLGVKYAPVAAVLAVLGLVRLARDRSLRSACGAAAGLAAAGVAYLVVHRLLYGGWTVYAAGDHFGGDELTVMGHRPNYLARSRRVVGLLLDRGFGLAAWMPGYLLVVPALAVLVRRRPPGWLALVLPAAAGWATATWVALTMHGWWWPGRQTVVVLPCLVLAVAWWIGRTARALRPAVWTTGLLGAATWLWLVVEVRRQRLTLIVDFESTSNPLYRAWRAVLPDYRHPGSDDWLLQAAWLAVLALAAVVAWRQAGGVEQVPPVPSTDVTATSVRTRRESHVGA
jgi:hypothetical protein